MASSADGKGIVDGVQTTPTTCHRAKMAVQRIRASFSDPDATESDSDSDDDDAMASPDSRRLGACTSNRNPSLSSEIIQPAVAAAPAPQPPPPPMQGGGANGARSAPKRRFGGVYERLPGRWVAEFRSRQLDVRRRIGTFPSEEEAMAAYDAYETQFHSVTLLGASPEGLMLSPTHWNPLVDGHGHGIDLVLDQPAMGLKQEADALATVTMEESCARVASVPFAPCVSSLTSSSPWAAAAAAASHETVLPHAGERGIFDPFMAADLAGGDDLIGLADLARLPFPPLDDDLDFTSGDWSLLNTGFQ